MQARTLLKNMQEAKKKEAPMLKNRLEQVEALQLLLHSKIKSFPFKELVAHVSVLQKGSITMPPDIMLQVFSRQCEDAFARLLEARGRAEAEPLILEIASRLAVWEEPEAEMSQLKLTAAVMHAYFQDDVAHQKRKGKLSQEQAATKTEELAQAGWASMHG